MESNTPDAPGRLERLLERVRTNGIWLFAGLAGVASINIIALVRDPLAAERAIGIAPGDVLLAALALAAGLEILLLKKQWKRSLPPPAAIGLVAAAVVSGLAMVFREWGEMPGAMRGAIREIVQLAGGVEALAARARELADTDIQLACYLTDMAFYADPDDAIAQELVIEIYRKRIKDPASNTMEMLTYLNQMVDARSRQMEMKEWQETQ